MRLIVLTLISAGLLFSPNRQAQAEITPFLVDEPLFAPGHQLHPSVSGSRVFWEEWREEDGSFRQFIRGLDLDSGEHFGGLGTTDPGKGPTVCGDLMVWRGSYGGEGGLMGLDLTTGQVAPLAVAERSQTHQAQTDGLLVWEDWRNSPVGVPPEYTNADVYGLNLQTGEEFPIATASHDQTHPSISGDIVVWADSRRSIPGLLDATDIYGRNLATGEEFQIAGGTGLDYTILFRPVISGDTVVWVGPSASGQGGLLGAHLSTGESFVIAQGGYSINFPAIDGRYVVWADGRNSEDSLDYDIWGYDLLTDEEFPIYEGAGQQQFPSISGNLVVWESDIPGETARVWGAYIPEPATGLLLTAGLAGVLIRRRHRPRT